MYWALINIIIPINIISVITKYIDIDKKESYEGEFNENEFHGKGKYYFSNGDIYEGDFEYGIRARKNNIPLYLTPNYVGIGERHDVVQGYYDTSKNIFKRIRNVQIFSFV